MTKPFLILSVLLITLATHVTAQNADSLRHFKYGGFSVLTFNQVNFSNWAAGGENALSAMGVLNLFGNYRNEKLEWENSLNLAYGLLKNNSSVVRKNNDKMELNSKVGYKAFGKFFYSALVDFQSQFTRGYDYPNDSIPVSDFLAPGYLSISLGFDYKPASFFSCYFSPAAGRFTFVTDQALADKGAYGVEPATWVNGSRVKKGKRVRSEFGANITTHLHKDILKSVNMDTKLTLFNNYTDKDKANRKNIDVNWSVMINIKAGKLLTTSIMTNLLYDQNMIARTQFMETLGVGISYKF